ncbi:MAG: DUF3098 domain-containing protein [Chitinophagales bacterium]|nr:DUF3098 domain-containing protein [Chitinophagales bacterium]
MSNTPSLLFNKTNYLLMALGLVFVILGFLLMAGGGEALGPDGYAHEFDESIYSFRRLTLAPIVIVAGFVIEVLAIMLAFKKA